jgi:hypothetical protein
MKGTYVEQNVKFELRSVFLISRWICTSDVFQVQVPCNEKDDKITMECDQTRIRLEIRTKRIKI